MDNWLSLLTYNPLNKLLSSNDEALTYFVKRELLNEPDHKVTNNNEINKIIERQQPDGSWIFKSNSVKKYPSINHNLIETFKSLRILVGKYEMNRADRTISRCADYVFSCQTEEGDIRGILGNQYMPYYCGLFIEYLIKAGYENDIRVEKAFNWLNSIRQTDGGWVIPLQTVKINKLDDSTYSSIPIIAEKTLPSSHLSTGMVLRAFANHTYYKNTDVAIKAGELLKTRFLKPDKYNDRKAPEYWIKFQYPYWWTTLSSSLDSLHNIGFTIKDRDIEKGIEWFLVNQDKSGLWKTSYDKGNKEKIALNDLWIAYSICRIIKFYLH